MVLGFSACGEFVLRYEQRMEQRYHLSLAHFDSLGSGGLEVNLELFPNNPWSSTHRQQPTFHEEALRLTVFQAEDDGCLLAMARNAIAEGQGGCRQYSCTLLPFPPRDGRDHLRCCTAVQFSFACSESAKTEAYAGEQRHN